MNDNNKQKGVPYNSDSSSDDLCAFQVYDTDAYQTLAVSTASKDPTDLNTRLGVFALGIAGEGGEVADHIKKFLGHGHELDKDKIIKELGDVLWYVAVMSHELGFKLTEVTSRNIEKLRKRYPNGFSVEASKNRKSDDV